jgi:hypothetical protein
VVPLKKSGKQLLVKRRRLHRRKLIRKSVLCRKILPATTR